MGSQISVEPVVAPDGSGYELKEEHLPILFKEYEKLAKYYAEKWQRRLVQLFSFYD